MKNNKITSNTNEENDNLFSKFYNLFLIFFILNNSIKPKNNNT